MPKKPKAQKTALPAVPLAIAGGRTLYGLGRAAISGGRAAAAASSKSPPAHKAGQQLMKQGLGRAKSSVENRGGGDGGKGIEMRGRNGDVPVPPSGPGSKPKAKPNAKPKAKTPSKSKKPKKPLPKGGDVSRPRGGKAQKMPYKTKLNKTPRTWSA